MKESKKHWETVYETKTPEQVSWTQEIPKTSIEFIQTFNLDKSAKIIDIGGGDSNLVDFLLAQGFENVTVLDISKAALKRAQKRLGKNAEKVNWIESDILDFKPSENFDVWHDRAAFHFLTSKEQIESYISIAKESVSGYLAIGTFSENGPKKCSGLDIKQYSEDELTEVMRNGFEKLKCINENHKTPFDTIQNFTFCSFRRSLN
jgi:SAM-dependent methyltransferase